MRGSSLKTAFLVVLWLALAYTVSSLILNSETTRTYALELALLAWLGGLVSAELVRPIINRIKKD